MTTTAERGAVPARVTIDVSGMTCAACSARIQRSLARTDGVADANVNLMTNSASVAFDPAVVSPDRLLAVIRETGYGAALPVPDVEPAEALAGHEAELAREARTLRAKAAYSIAVGIIVMAIGMAPWTRWLGLALTLPVVLWAGRHFYVRAWRAARHRGADMSTLVAIGTGSAMLFSVGMTLFADRVAAQGVTPHVYYEAVAFIIGFVLLGNLLEARAKHRTTDAIRRLVGLRPDTARRLDGDVETVVPTTSVRVGDQLRIKPGDRIPVDAVVLEGTSLVDESMLTGEPLPVHKEAGATVAAGTVNAGGILAVRAARVGRDTMLARIVGLVKEAQASRAPIQQLADRIAAVFVPAVMAVAAITFVIWASVGPAPTVLHALVAAVTVLIIACPCAMGLAVPTAVMVATGRGAELGLLVKGGEALQRMQDVDTVVFDKTGTLTQGKPEVREVLPLRSGDPLALAAALERASEHPLGAAVVREAERRELALATVESIANVPGKGVTGIVGGHAVLVGNRALLDDYAVDVQGADAAAARMADGGMTAVFVAVDGLLLGVIGIGDAPRPEARETVAELRAIGLRVVMLTGDNERTARAIAREVGIDRIVADVRPDGKLAAIEALHAERRVVAMVGDGINDAPALAKADVGIAIGTGTDVAVETASLTLMRGDLRGVAQAIALSRKTLRVIRQNLFWAFAYNVIGIPIAAGALYPAFGLQLSPAIAAAAMAVSSVSVVTNSLRLKRWKP